MNTYKRIISILLSCVMLFGVIPTAFAEEKTESESVAITRDGGMFEAEILELPSSNWQLIEDSEASGGYYIMSVAENANTFSRYEVPEADSLKIKFTIAEAGNYSLHFRVLTPPSKMTFFTKAEDSTLWKSIGGYPKESFDHTKKFSWITYASAYYTPGEHYFLLCYDRNIGIDKFLFSTNGVDMPEGKGENLGRFTFDGRDGLSNLIYPLPAVVPESNVHPRLMLKGKDIEQIKANLTHERNAGIYSKFLESANQDYDCILDPTATSDNTNFKYLEYIEANAFLYALYKDEERGYKAINGMLNYLNTFTAEKSGNAASRNGPFMIYIAGLVYDWCFDLMTTENKEDFVNYCILHLKKSEMTWPPTGLAGTIGHGEEVTIGYTMMFAIACYDEYPELYNTMGGKFFMEALYSRNMRYNDNFHLEQGDFYSIRSQCDWFTVLVLEQLGCRDMYYSNIKNSPYQYIYRLLPNGGRMRDGDGLGYPLSKVSEEGLMSFLGGIYYNDPYLYGDFFKYFDYAGGWDQAMLKSTYLILNDVNMEIKQREGLPLSMYAGDGMGMMTARTSWDEGVNSNTMVVSMKLPERFYAGHQKRDAGHFYIYYKGPLALTSGVYTGAKYTKEDGTIETNIGSGSDHNKYYAKNTIAHNCVLIYNPEEVTNGRGNSGGQYPPDSTSLVPYIMEKKGLGYGDVLAYDYGDDLNKPHYTYSKGDIGDWYGAKATDYTRSFMFFNFFDDVYPGALIVFDSVTSARAEYDKYWLLHSQEEPEIDGNVTTMRHTKSGYNGRLVNETLLPKADNLNIKKVGGEGMEYTDLSGTNWKAVPQDEFNDESGKWRIEVTPKEKSKTDYFLNVLQVSDNTLNPVPLKSELLESGKFVGVKIRDRVAFFSKERNRTAEAQTLNITGTPDEKLKIVVADLKEGEWEVTGPDNKTQTVVSYKNGGVLSFEGTPGEYKLAYVSDKIVEKNIDILSNAVDTDKVLYCVYNLLFSSEIPVRLFNDTAYVGIEKLAKNIDSMHKYTENGNKVQVELFKGTDNHRILTFEVDSGTYTIEPLKQGGELQTVTAKLPVIKDYDNTILIPMEMITSKSMMATYVGFEELGGVLRIQTSFKRDEKKIGVKEINDGRVKVTKVTASPTNAGVLPEETHDDNIQTTYYVYGNDNFIEYTLENVETISNVGIIWGSRTSRQAKFEIFVSEDGENYTSVWNGMSDTFPEKTEEDKRKFQDFNFKPVKAKYVRLGLYGSSNKDISTILELRICK